MSPLSSLGQRLAIVNEHLMDAADAGARLGLDVRSIATAVEDLLDLIVPTLRGCAADR